MCIFSRKIYFPFQPQKCLWFKYRFHLFLNNNHASRLQPIQQMDFLVSVYNTFPAYSTEIQIPSNKNAPRKKWTSFFLPNWWGRKWAKRRQKAGNHCSVMFALFQRTWPRVINSSGYMRTDGWLPIFLNRTTLKGNPFEFVDSGCSCCRICFAPVLPTT